MSARLTRVPKARQFQTVYVPATITFFSIYKITSKLLIILESVHHEIFVHFPHVSNGISYTSIQLTVWKQVPKTLQHWSSLRKQIWVFLKTALKMWKIRENNVNEKHVHFSYLLNSILHASIWQTIWKWQPKNCRKIMNSVKLSLVYLKLLLYG
jgi:hypothetical protein